jgi:hypothetical protein
MDDVKRLLGDQGNGEKTTEHGMKKKEARKVS